MPAATRRLTTATAALVLGLATMLVAADHAEARKAGSSGFGSRGSKTWSAPAPTQTAPGTAAPMQRSMTPQQQTNPGMASNPAAAQRQGMFGGFGKAMVGGLLMGGLIGMLMGNGLGGMAGFLGLLLQAGLIAAVAMLAYRFFAARRQPAAATAAAGNAYTQAQPAPANTGSFGSFGFGGGAAPAAAPAVQTSPIEVQPEDLERFEQMLSEVQAAYSREDYSALRKLSTPEAMSFLAEELGELASSGKRNMVSDVKLLQGDISEAWSEGNVEYVTVAMRYSAVDITVDRTTGTPVPGSSEEPQESVELWTFTRKQGEEWLLAAIQGTE